MKMFLWVDHAGVTPLFPAFCRVFMVSLAIFEFPAGPRGSYHLIGGPIMTVGTVQTSSEIVVCRDDFARSTSPLALP